MNVNAASLLWAVLVFLGFIASVCLHEFGHAVVAYWGGDRSVKDKGYLTLNPLKYTHPTYSIVMPLIFLLLGGLPLPGAAVYINTGALRSRAWRSAVSGAGPLATLGVAIAVAMMIRHLNPDYALLQDQFFGNTLSLTQVSGMNWLVQGLLLLLELEVAGVLLNLMPVPGLDGFGIIEPWLSPSTQLKIRKISRFGVLILFGAFWVIPQFNRGFWGVVNSGVQFLGVPPDVADLAFFLFRQNAQLLFFVLLVGLVIGNQWKKRSAPQTQPQAANLETRLEEINTQLALGQTAPLLAEKTAVLIHLQRHAEAMSALDLALALAPEDAEKWAMKGQLCHRLQRDKDAIAAYDQALRHAGDPQSYNNILLLKSRSYYWLDCYSDCLDLLDKVLASEPENATAWYNKACCYAKLGDLEQGISCLENVISYGNDDLRAMVQSDDDLAALRSHPGYAVLKLGEP